MAERVSISNKTWEELEREITCAVCQEHYNEPKILPCQHYYCKACIQRMDLRTGTGQPFACPECRFQISLSDGGVDGLKPAFFVNRLFSTICSKEPLPVDVSHCQLEALQCELCTDSGSSAKAFCRQCTMFVCDECVKQHKRIKTYTSHEVVSVEDLKQRKRKIAVEPAKCQDHREPLVLYCFNCNTLLCRDCIMKDHKDHIFEFCAKAAVNTRQKLEEKLVLLKSQKLDLQAAVRKIQVKKEELKDRKDILAQNTKTVFKELRDILDHREEELLAEVGAAVEKKTGMLIVQNEELSSTCAEVQSLIDGVEQCVLYESDNEVMNQHCSMFRQIKRQLKRSGSERSWVSVKARDIAVEFSCADALKELCYSQARVFDQPLVLNKYRVSLDVEEKSEVGKAAVSTLTITQSNGCALTRKVEVTVCLKSLCSGALVNGTVEDTLPGVFRLCFTPVIRGRHELIVSIGGQQNAGCTFPVFVAISPKELTKPVNVWRNIQSPAGITATSTGDILVLENQRNIVKLEGSGDVAPFAVQDELTGLCEIEVDSEDNVYCIQHGSCKILKCNRNGGNITLKELGDSELELQDLAVVGTELVVAQVEKNMIHVYDRNMSYLRTIEDPRNGEVVALSSDDCGNIYCADYKNACIQVFSNDGMFLRCINCHGMEVRKLREPHGVCVFGCHVYVLEGHTRSVSIFTTDGAYVSSFGRSGDRDGEFILPFSICVDRDGFVYVTDNANGRVQCF